MAKPKDPEPTKTAMTKTAMTKTALELTATLGARFEKHMSRHPHVRFTDVVARLSQAPAALRALQHMEESGGEPDVVGVDDAGAFLFFDCSSESPKGRRSVCYDRAALDSRKENKPSAAAAELAAQWGSELLDEAQYRYLQTLGRFDEKTSSWVKTPENIRKLGGAVFCDRRYDAVFYYHNGAESYYAARGFRCVVRV